MPYYDQMTEEQKKQVDEAISRQMFIQNIADIKYMCYLNGIGENEFWQKFLWAKIDFNIVGADQNKSLQLLK